MAFVSAGLAGRHLPPDIAFHRLDPAARRAAAGPPQPETARLRVAFARDALGVARMDILLDGVRIGQLRPGMAFVVPMRPGLRVLSASVWLRRLDLRDHINALPSTDADFTIRASGGRSRSFGVDRADLGPTLRDARTTLVEPAVRLA